MNLQKLSSWRRYGCCCYRHLLLRPVHGGGTAYSVFLRLVLLLFSRIYFFFLSLLLILHLARVPLLFFFKLLRSPASNGDDDDDAAIVPTGAAALRARSNRCAISHFLCHPFRRPLYKKKNLFNFWWPSKVVKKYLDTRTLIHPPCVSNFIKTHVVHLYIAVYFGKKKIVPTRFCFVFNDKSSSLLLLQFYSFRFS